MAPNFDHQATAEHPETGLAPLFAEALDLLDKAEQRITHLSNTLLTGQPRLITEETVRFEEELNRVDRHLLACHHAVRQLGYPALQDAACAFQAEDRGLEGEMLGRLIKQLNRVVALCAAGAKRASQLDRDLNRAIGQLRDAGMATGPRLIASA